MFSGRFSEIQLSSRSTRGPRIGNALRPDGEREPLSGAGL